MFKQCAIAFTIAFAVSLPARAADVNICGDTKGLFCTSLGGYLTFDNGQYVIYPNQKSAEMTWEYLYITTSEKTHTPSPPFPVSIQQAMRNLASDTVLSGIFEYCVLLQMIGYPPGSPQRKNLERLKQGKPLPAKICRAWGLKPIAKYHVENEILVHRKAAQEMERQRAGSKKSARR